MVRAAPLFSNDKWESELLVSFHELHEANDHHGVLLHELVAHVANRFNQPMEPCVARASSAHADTSSSRSKNGSAHFFEIPDEDNARISENTLAMYFHDVSKYPVQKRAKEIQWFTELDNLYRKIIAWIRVSKSTQVLARNAMLPKYCSSGADEYDNEDISEEDCGYKWLRFWWRERNWRKIDMSVKALHGAMNDGSRDCVESGDIKNALSCLRPFYERASVLRKEIVEHNLRIVIHAAKSYRDFSFDVEDIIQEGNIGLVHAVDKFFVKKGYKFITYAMWWIRSHISRYVYRRAGMVAIPVHTAERLIRMRKAQEHFQQKHERSPSPEELACILKCDIDWVNELLSISGRDVSLSQLVSPQGDTALIDLLKTKIQDERNQLVTDCQRSKLVATILECLPPRVASVIDLRFGLATQESHTLNEVGDMLAGIYKSRRLTRERIRQLEKQGLQRIKDNPRAMNALRELRLSCE